MYINSMFSMLFLSSNHPVMMIILLMSFTLMTSFKSYLILNNAWFGYTITLIMIGGMMVLFIYMASILPNQKFKISIPTLITSLLIMLLIKHQHIQSWTQNLFNNPMIEFNCSIITIMLTSYLLLTMIIINQSTTHSEGPMRSI
uniref:NADH dehydrogenase subunit 6 n=1 Tax=Pseudocellus pearsei TaxID=58148 RepID=A9LI82_9ARAC|nr:NADH dehydrogenase subunit 6 [Pseudocellus pearsei]ABS71913.1 NADH dehydrogenase subunit 6 [Pseudocellus pearsei]